jgi:hypothetical protein
MAGAWNLPAQPGGDVTVPKDFGGKTRLLAHPATDKPMYKPGETVYGRAAILDAFTRVPAADNTRLKFEVRSPRGDVATEGDATVEHGVAAFSWAIPAGQAGGEYKLLVKFPYTGDPTAETNFLVRSYRVPRLKMQLEFVRKAYGPGDDVMATLLAMRAEGGIPAGAKVTAIAQVDGVEVHRAELALSSQGALVATFKLPAAIETGDGNLVFIVEDGGVQETAAKTIPIVLNKVALAFYPEGGELVGGLATRLYLEARNNKALPADVAGRVVDSEGNVAANFRTVHEGRGRAEFTPRAGMVYHAVVDEPAGIKAHYPLPPVAEAGVVLAAADDVVRAGGPLKVRVAATAAGKYKVIVARLEREAVFETVELKAGGSEELVLNLGPEVDGVLRVTAFDWQDKPLAERLVLRLPKREVNVEVKTEPASSSPGSKVKVRVATTDATGEPVAATVLLDVVDDAVLETVEKRERAPRLPVQVLLASDVRELADAQVYLAGGEEAALRTDLLLGTQGWRRFAYREPQAFVKEHGDRALRALAARVPPPEPVDRFEGAFGGGEPRLLRAGAPPMPGAMPRAAMAQGKGGEPEGVMEEGAVPEAGAEPVPAPMAAPAAPELAGKPMGDEMPAAPEEEMGRADREFFAPKRKAQWALQNAVEAPAPVYVRVYAHAAQPAQVGVPRRDFAETLYWNSALVTDAKGQGSFEFDLSDSITTYRVRANALGKDGALGEGDATVESRKAFYLEAKLPLEVTAGDRPEIPVALVSGSASSLSAVLSAELTTGLALVEALPSALELAPEQRLKVYLPLSVGSFAGEASVRVGAKAGEFEDDVRRVIPVVPAGFPTEVTFGGQLADKAEHTLEIPAGVDAASVKTEAAIHPTPLGALTEALKSLLAEPCGCFEQTSSSNYPNVMILQYLKSHRVDDPELLKRTNELLESGYKKLTGYECKEKGYEWFGGDPGHEALTAYGTMEFVDMAKVYPVDQPMVERTRAWLMARRDGKGGFQRNERALDSFGRAPQDITDAYIAWALSEAGERGLEKELARLKELAGSSDDPYFLGLVANVFVNLGEKEPAASAMKKLAAAQKADGRLSGTRMSITGSGGDSLDIETTSLAVLAWLRAPEHTANVEKAMKFVLEMAKGGRFGATQATILALKAIIAYDAARSTPKKDGTALLSIDGKLINEVPFTKDREGAILLPSFAKYLTPGAHKVELKMVEGSEMPYSILVRYFTSKPASSAACKVGLATRLAKAEIAEGETLDLSVEVTNRTTEGVPMTVAIVGLPGGLETRPDQLKELLKGGTVDAYETRGREVVFYWRGMAPSSKRSVVLNLVAAIPGAYTGPASRVYLYYTDEHKDWADGLAVKVTR